MTDESKPQNHEHEWKPVRRYIDNKIGQTVTHRCACGARLMHEASWFERWALPKEDGK